MIFLKGRKSKKEKANEQMLEGSLRGQLLVATSQIRSSCFHRAVVLVCEHNEKGSMGIIINKEMRGVSQDEIIDKLPIKQIVDKKNINIPIYLGGPVETTRGFVVHSDDYSIKNTIKFADGICVSAEGQVLIDHITGKGPKKMFLAMGCAGWTAGQLEDELEDNSWLVVPPTREIVLDTPNSDKWKLAARKIGIDINKFVPINGNA